MTDPTVNTGWLLFGISLAVLGAGLIFGVRSRWAEKQATEAHRITGTESPAQFAHSLDAGGAEYADADLERLARSIGMTDLRRAAHMADAMDKVVPLPGRRLSAVPEQRDGRWS